MADELLAYLSGEFDDDDATYGDTYNVLWPKDLTTFEVS